MKTILISGGAGFIGSHLVKHYIDQKSKVIVIDNLYTGNKDNIKPFYKKGLAFLRKDISAGAFNYFQDIKFDEVLHFASPASPVHYMQQPFMTMKANSIGTEFLLNLAVRDKAKFLLASTSEIYGDPTVHPQTESYWGNVNSFGPRSCYSEDTEVLTDKGWVLLTNIKKSHLIPTLNENNKIEYFHPVKIIKDHYCGKMFHFENQKMDLLVTPNHKMIDDSSGTRRFLPADSAVAWNKRNCPVSGTWLEEKKAPLVFHLSTEWIGKKGINYGKISFDLWLELLGVYLSEGCISSGHRIIFTHGNNRKKKKLLKQLFSKLPFHISDSDHQFTISSNQLENALRPFGKCSRDKKITREILNLSPDKLKIVFKGIMLDGAIDGRCLYTVSEELANNTQEMAIKLGKAASIVSYYHKSNPWSNSLQYRVNIRPAEKARYHFPKETNYNGLICCVEMPKNHTIMVRRKGKAVFCGNCYDESKRFAETLTYLYIKHKHLDARIVRTFNVYGPRMCKEDGRAIPAFIGQALQNKPITVFGSGLQTRSLCYIDDYIDGVMRLLKSDVKTPVNIGNPHEITMIDLAKLIKTLCCSASEIQYHPLPEDDPKQRCPDISIAESVLNWQPKISLEKGLLKTIEYFKEDQR